MAAHVDYVKSVDRAVCGKHAVSYFGACFLVELRVLVSIDVYTSMLTEIFLHEHFVPPPEVASLSQQGRTAAAQRA